MLKKLVAIVILRILLYVLYPYAKKDEVRTFAEPTNFVEEGYLSFDSPGNRQDTPYFSYKENLLAPTTTVGLVIDENSVCVTTNGALPCIAMSVLWNIPFGGKRAVVEAYESGGEIRVRALRVIDGVIEEGGVLIKPNKGVVYISWIEAIELIKECKVNLIMQLHSLNVDLKLRDGSEVTAIEPMIDEVFRVYDEAKERCGNVPIATE